MDFDYDSHPLCFDSIPPCLELIRKLGLTYDLAAGDDVHRVDCAHTILRQLLFTMGGEGEVAILDNLLSQFLRFVPIKFAAS